MDSSSVVCDRQEAYGLGSLETEHDGVVVLLWVALINNGFGMES
jgi:hypothetical protein